MLGFRTCYSNRCSFIKHNIKRSAIIMKCKLSGIVAPRRGYNLKHLQKLVAKLLSKNFNVFIHKFYFTIFSNIKIHKLQMNFEKTTYYLY